MENYLLFRETSDKNKSYYCRKVIKCLFCTGSLKKVLFRIFREHFDKIREVQQKTIYCESENY